jgi:hypothetical protein
LPERFFDGSVPFVPAVGRLDFLFFYPAVGRLDFLFFYPAVGRLDFLFFFYPAVGRLDFLFFCAAPEAGEEIRCLFAKLAEDRFNLVVGRFSRGKTSLLSFIAGGDG